MRPTQWDERGQMDKDALGRPCPKKLNSWLTRTLKLVRGRATELSSSPVQVPLVLALRELPRRP
jgi:hypothetical protein